MSDISPEEKDLVDQIDKRTKKIVIFGLILITALAIIFFAKTTSKKKNTKKSTASKSITVDYEVVSKQEYARDGQKCMAYRVYVSSKPSYSEFQTIFSKVTNDGYYLHTVWFYTSKSDANGSGAADWTMEQTSQDSIPSAK